MRPNAEVLAYYPTHPDHAPALANLITTTEGSQPTLLDPCAGTGEFLLDLARQLNVKPYGVELNADRAADLAKNMRLNHSHYAAIQDDAHKVSLRNFDAVYCNPPYMHEKTEEGTKRAEIGFLRLSIDALKPDGLLVANLSKTNMKNKEVLSLLLRRLHTLSFYEAPTDEWDQVYAVGYRREYAITVPQEQVDKTHALLDGSEPDKTELQRLTDEEVHHTYTITESDTEPLFKPREASLVNLVHAARSVGIIARGGVQRLIRKPIKPLKLMMDPRTGHIPGVLTQLAPTLAMTDGSLVRAIVRPQTSSSTETEIDTQGGKTSTTTTFVHDKTVAIKQLTPHGDIIDLDGLDLATLINDNIVHLTEQIHTISPPTYREYDYAGYAPLIREMSPNRPIPGTQYSGLLPTQAHAAAAITRHLEQNQHAILAGEMGTGKTTMATAVASLTNAKFCVVLSPPHLMSKWEKEIKEVLPNTYTTQARKISEAEAFFAREDDQLSFIVIPSTAALSSGWNHALLVLGKRGVSVPYRTNKNEHPKPANKIYTKRFPHIVPPAIDPNQYVLSARDKYNSRHHYKCPSCFLTLVSANGRIRDHNSDFLRTKHICQCGEPLWQQTRRTRKTDKAATNFREWSIYASKLQASIREGKKPRYKRPENPGYAKTDLMAYIANYHAGKYFLIADEVHLYASTTSTRGDGYRKLVAACYKSVSMTGTLTNGKASSLFATLYATNIGGFRDLYGYGDITRFIKDHGTLIEKDISISYHNRSGTKQVPVPAREHPGISHGISGTMLPGTAYLKLEDMGINIPKPKQIIVPAPMTDGMKAIYLKLVNTIKPELAASLSKGSKAMLSTYIWTLQGWPNAVHRGVTVSDPKGNVLLTVPPAPDHPNPKLQNLITDLTNDKQEGRRGLIFFQQTMTLDIMPWYQEKLEAAGLKTKICTVAPEKRREWFEHIEKEDVDVVLLHPKRVALGLDLVAWPSLNFFEQPKEATTFLQALARPRRLGQLQRITARHYIWEDSLEAHQLYINASKLVANATVDGAIPDPTMAKLADGARENPVIALAKSVIENETRNIADLATVLAAATATIDATGRVIEGADKLYIPDDPTPQYWQPVASLQSSATNNVVDLYKTPFGNTIVVENDKARQPLDNEEFAPVSDETHDTQPDIPTAPQTQDTEAPPIADETPATEPVTPAQPQHQKKPRAAKRATPKPIWKTLDEWVDAYYQLTKRKRVPQKQLAQLILSLTPATLKHQTNYTHVSYMLDVIDNELLHGTLKDDPKLNKHLVKLTRVGTKRLKKLVNDHKKKEAWDHKQAKEAQALTETEATVQPPTTKEAIHAVGQWLQQNIESINALVQPVLDVLIPTIEAENPQDMDITAKRNLLSLSVDHLSFAIDAAMMMSDLDNLEPPKHADRDTLSAIVAGLLNKHLSRAVAPIILGKKVNLQPISPDEVTVYVKFDMHPYLRKT